MLLFRAASDDDAQTRSALAALEAPRPDRGRVLLFRTSNDDGLLSQQMAQLNYGVVETGSSLVQLLSTGPCLAAIADAPLEDALPFFIALPPQLPKILISSDVSFDTRIAAARANVDGLIKRPVDVAELSDWLERCETRRTAPSISVLLVDDDALTAEIHAQILRVSGIQVTIVMNPAQVIDAIEAIVPDLVLMDVHMPDVDGIELARVIRQCNEYLLLPIVFLSAERDGGCQVMARALGGDDFIVKPVEPQTFVSTIRLRAERSRSLRSLVERDSLTGLLNHGRFKERASQEILRAHRSHANVTLAMLDIDHFKQVNDIHGHPAGDKVIRTLARVLAGRLRTTDVIGRYGGEEFGIIFPDTAATAAVAILDGIRKSIADTAFESAAGRFSVTFSAGIVEAEGADVFEAINAADIALYRAKSSGRNRIELLTDRGVPHKARSPRRA